MFSRPDFRSPSPPLYVFSVTNPTPSIVGASLSSTIVEEREKRRGGSLFLHQSGWKHHSIGLLSCPSPPEEERDSVGNLGVVEVSNEHLVVGLVAETNRLARRKFRILVGVVVRVHQVLIPNGVVPTGCAKNP